MPGGRVLVTGRHGFTGRYLAKELEQSGWEVWGVGASAALEEDPRYFQADLTNRESLENAIAKIQPDAVIHLAAIAFIAHGAAEDFYRVNVIGTRCLLDILAASGMANDGVVLASSANVYGNSTVIPITESAPPAPINDYAVSKLAMEHMARLFLDKLPIVIARPFNYTGLGQAKEFLVPKIVSHFRDRRTEIELGNLDVSRDFSDVRDVARAYSDLLHFAPPGEVFNVCSGKATALQDVIDMCQKITGHDICVSVNPDFVRSNEVKTLKGDPSRLDELSRHSERRNFYQTLEWMLNEADISRV
ncbi:MAG: NAD-dependent epimerase/dehydratase family protein [Pseudomonadota bacterium]